MRRVAMLSLRCALADEAMIDNGSVPVEHQKIATALSAELREVLAAIEGHRAPGAAA